MIISASRRTDIPRSHSDWFLNRVREGCVDVRNPLFPGQVSRYSLSRAVPSGASTRVIWRFDPLLVNRDHTVDKLTDHRGNPTSVALRAPEYRERVSPLPWKYPAHLHRPALPLLSRLHPTCLAPGQKLAA